MHLVSPGVIATILFSASLSRCVGVLENHSICLIFDNIVSDVPFEISDYFSSEQASDETEIWSLTSKHFSSSNGSNPLEKSWKSNISTSQLSTACQEGQNWPKQPLCVNLK